MRKYRTPIVCIDSERSPIRHDIRTLCAFRAKWKSIRCYLESRCSVDTIFCGSLFNGFERAPEHMATQLVVRVTCRRLCSNCSNASSHDTHDELLGEICQRSHCAETSGKYSAIEPHVWWCTKHTAQTHLADTK